MEKESLEINGTVHYKMKQKNEMFAIRRLSVERNQAHIAIKSEHDMVGYYVRIL